MFERIDIVEQMCEYDELFCREYLLEDPVLTDAMLGYLDLCRAGERVRSKKYTLDFIDYCLRLL